MRNLFESNLSQMWFNAQNMDVKERKYVIKYIIGLTKTNGCFIDYNAKYFLASLIDSSECYYNSIGTHTKVKQFEKLGWYDNNGKLDFNKIMN